MSKILKTIFFICICAGFLQCSNNSVSPDNEPALQLSKAQKNLVKSDNKFGLKLFKEVVKEEPDKNVFISPLSVSMALGMTYNGSDGSTKVAMENVLELSGLSIMDINESYKSLIALLRGLDSKVEFNIANSIWYRQGFTVEKEFVDLNMTYFDAVVNGLDFNQQSAVTTMNNWVNEKTNGKIQDIVDSPINPLTVMFLINAMYFKGTWTYEFDKSKTQDSHFYLADSTKKPCRLMYQKTDYLYYENDDFQMVDLPYGNGKFSMAVLLPKAGLTVDSLITEITETNWNTWVSSLSETKVSLYLPRFKLEYDITLNDALKVLGMKVAFDPYQADFTKINRNGDLYISKVKHKTFVEVDEEGTEAAAATSVEIGFVSVMPSEIFMRVDRPFVFAIRENYSQTILFIGKIVEPLDL